MITLMNSWLQTAKSAMREKKTVQWSVQQGDLAFSLGSRRRCPYRSDSWAEESIWPSGRVKRASQAERLSICKGSFYMGGATHTILYSASSPSSIQHRLSKWVFLPAFLFISLLHLNLNQWPFISPMSSTIIYFPSRNNAQICDLQKTKQ